MGEMLRSRFGEALGWTLVHSFWELALVGALCAGMLFALRRRSANLRYVVGCLGLVLMLGGVACTYVYLLPVESVVLGVRSVADMRVVPVGERVSGAPVVMGEVASWELKPVQLAWRARVRAAVEPWLPVGVGCYLVGAGVVLLRLLAGYGRLRRVVGGATGIEGHALECLGVMRRRMGVGRAVRLMRSAAIEVPTLMGAVRPVILLPASALMGLSAEQLEALLAHELAHIRRHDYVANVVQSVVETVLFYHPVVWWLSARVRQEREHCCDDAAVAVTGNRVGYARALAAMETLRVPGGVALAAGGGSLLMRVRRVLGEPAGGRGPGRLVTTTGAAVVMLVLGAVIYVGCSSTGGGSGMPRWGDGAARDFGPGDGQIKVDAQVLMVPTKVLEGAGMKWGVSLPAEVKRSVMVGAKVTNSEVPQVVNGATMDAAGLERFLAEIGKDKGTQTVARPHILLVDGQAGRVEIAQQQNYVKGYKRIEPPAGSNEKAKTNLEIDTLTTGLRLDLTARISADRKVIGADIHPAFSTLDGMDTFTTSNVADASALSGEPFVQVPKVTNLEFKTRASISNGDVLVMVGPRRTLEKEVVTEVPGLSKLPGVGGLFTNRKYEEEEYTMVVVVRPEVVTAAMQGQKVVGENQVNVASEYLLVSSDFIDDFRIQWTSGVPSGSGSKPAMNAIVVDEWTSEQLTQAMEKYAGTIVVGVPPVSMAKGVRGVIGNGAQRQRAGARGEVVGKQINEEIPSGVAGMRVRLTPGVSADGKNVELKDVSYGQRGTYVPGTGTFSIPEGGTLLIYGGEVKADDAEVKPSRRLFILVKPSVGEAVPGDPFHFEFDRTVPVPGAATKAAALVPTTAKVAATAKGQSIDYAMDGIADEKIRGWAREAAECYSKIALAQRVVDAATQQFMAVLQIEDIRSPSPEFLQMKRVSVEDMNRAMAAHDGAVENFILAMARLDQLDGKLVNVEPRDAFGIQALVIQVPGKPVSMKLPAGIQVARFQLNGATSWQLIGGNSYRIEVKGIAPDGSLTAVVDGKPVVLIEAGGASAPATKAAAQTGDLNPYGELMSTTGGKEWPELRNSLTAEEARGRRNEVTRDRLEKKILEFIVDGSGLERVFNLIRDHAGSNLFINWEALKSAGIERDTKVTLRLNEVSLRLALEEVLEQVGKGELGYYIEDGVMMVATKEEAEKAVGVTRMGGK